MKVLYISCGEMILRGCYGEDIDKNTYVQLRLKTDGERLYVSLEPMVPKGYYYNYSIEVPVTYNGEKKYVIVDKFDSEVGVDFAYDGGVKELTIGCRVKYLADDFADGYVIKWKGSYTDPAPEFDFRLYGVRLRDDVSIYWQSQVPASVSENAGMWCSLIMVYETLNRSVIDGTEVRTVRESGRMGSSGSASYSIAFNTDDTCRYRGVAALYSTPEAGLEDYIGIAEVNTPVFTAQPAYTLFSPYDFTYSEPTAGASVKLSWSVPIDNLEMSGRVYELERSVDGESYGLIYSGESVSFTDMAEHGWSRVRYRVRAVPVNSVYGRSSNWVYGSELAVTQTNVYVYTSGGIKPASAIYIGNKSAVPVFQVKRE